MRRSHSGSLHQAGETVPSRYCLQTSCALTTWPPMPTLLDMTYPEPAGTPNATPWFSLCIALGAICMPTAASPRNARQAHEHVWDSVSEAFQNGTGWFRDTWWSRLVETRRPSNRGCSSSCACWRAWVCLSDVYCEGGACCPAGGHGRARRTACPRAAPPHSGASAPMLTIWGSWSECSRISSKTPHAVHQCAVGKTSLQVRMRSGTERVCCVMASLQ